MAEKKKVLKGSVKAQPMPSNNFGTLRVAETCKKSKLTIIGSDLVLKDGCGSSKVPLSALGATDCVEVNTCVNTQLGLPNAGSLTNFTQAVVSAYEAHIAAGGADPEFAGEVLATLQSSPAAINEVLNILNTALATSPNPLLSNLCSYINDCIDAGSLTVSNDSGNLITTGTDGGAFLNIVPAINVSYDNTTSGLTATTVQDAIDELVDKTTQWGYEGSASINVAGSTITLLQTPSSDAQLWLHRNGLRLELTEDYTRLGNVITLVIPEFASDKFIASYQF